MSEFKIDKNVPIPVGSGKGKTKYPWAQLDVGDSFFVPGKKPSSISHQTTTASKRTGFKFSTRTVDGGVRVWRVE